MFYEYAIYQYYNVERGKFCGYSLFQYEYQDSESFGCTELASVKPIKENITVQECLLLLVMLPQGENLRNAEQWIEFANDREGIPMKSIIYTENYQVVESESFADKKDIIEWFLDSYQYHTGEVCSTTIVKTLLAGEYVSVKDGNLLMEWHLA